MPAFSNQDAYDLQCLPFERLCKQAVNILKDIGICPNQKAFIRSPEFDLEGIDFSIDSVLSEVPRCIRNVDRNAQSHEWFIFLIELLDVLGLSYV